ncbi:hypothetical protein [Persephonella sp.]|uniref:hypothetical protein n=1 Tax=Persephonella sp. TaxID=2060922 RepID=UPI0026275B84|nr:hypothetical protein [Persephonella sp.]
MENIYQQKSLERLYIAKLSDKEGLLYSLASNLYFSVFNYMQSILKEPPHGKWKHLGIVSYFSRYCMENDIYSKKELKIFSKNYRELYELRRKADYLNMEFDKEDKLKINELFSYFEEVIKNGCC